MNLISKQLLFLPPLSSGKKGEQYDMIAHFYWSIKTTEQIRVGSIKDNQGISL